MDRVHRVAAAQLAGVRGAAIVLATTGVMANGFAIQSYAAALAPTPSAIPVSSVRAEKAPDDPWPAFGPVFAQGVALLHEACNAISYGSAPDLGARLIGRVMNGDPVTLGEPTACPGAPGAPARYDEHESLSLVELDPPPQATQEIHAPLILAAGTCRNGGGLSLCYGRDGELTVRLGTRTLWSSGRYTMLDATLGSGPAVCNGCLARFQTDGNLVLYRPAPQGTLEAYWASGTSGHAGARLLLSLTTPYLALTDAGHGLLFPHQAVYRYKVLDTSRPVRIEEGRQQILSAYDASLAPFEGEYWVAFECALASGVTAACLGPLVGSEARLAIDIDRISVVAAGQCARALSICSAASVPKLIDRGGDLYLAWDDVRIDNRGRPRNDWQFAPGGADVQQYFISIDVRGARLERAAGSARLYVEGRHGAIVESDPGASSLLLSNVDLSQLVSVGTHVLATGSLTQSGATAESTCAMPLNHVKNCYRLAFATAESALGPFHLIPSESRGLAAVALADGIPQRPALDNRFIYLPASGRTALVGGLFFDITAPPPHLAYSSVSEMYLWPDELLHPVCDPATRPYPRWMAYEGRCLERHAPAVH